MGWVLIGVLGTGKFHGRFFGGGRGWGDRLFYVIALLCALLIIPEVLFLRDDGRHFYFSSSETSVCCWVIG